MRKREKYEHFLSTVELLESMDAYERQKIADAIKPISIDKGEYIVRQVLT